jgi:hypothetical protein
MTLYTRTQSATRSAIAAAAYTPFGGFGVQIGWLYRRNSDGAKYGVRQIVCNGNVQ